MDKSAEVVLPEGVELETYRKSGVVLWNHDKNKPVASCGWIKLHKGLLRAKTIYPEKPDEIDTPWFADTIWGMTKCVPPILRCKSIGFQPLLPMRDPTREELDEHPEWAGAGVWEKTMLLEYSCVYTGCLPDAIVEAINTKSLDADVMKEMGIEVPARVEVPPVEVTPPCCKDVEKYKSDTCVSARIEALMRGGTPERTAVAIAWAECHAVKRKTTTPKPPSPARIVARAVAKVDVDAIVERAIRLHRNRGKV